MNGAKKSATIYGAVGDNIVIFQTISAGNLPLPSNIVNFKLSYGTTIVMTVDNVTDMSNVTFTITGKFNNIIISETIQGPNATSIVSNNYYDNIISINASVSNPNPLYLSVNVNTVTFLDNADVSLANNYNLNKFSVLASSLDVNNEGWGQANYFIYGVNGVRPSVLTEAMLTPNLIYKDVEPFDLLRAYPKTPYFYFINDPIYSITQNDLQNGYIVTTEYPFDSIIVNTRNNLIQTPTIIEISQS